MGMSMTHLDHLVRRAQAEFVYDDMWSCTNARG